ncbi:MAG: hypothetical protein K8R65_02615, partial [Nitrospirae bacterium]|nr:hypothetical protein [Nitrospirota bacterium]
MGQPKNTRDYTRILGRLTEALASVPDSTLMLEEASLHQPGYRLATITLGHRHSRRALLTAGTHGDEPSGVEALC